MSNMDIQVASIEKAFMAIANDPSIPQEDKDALRQRMMQSPDEVRAEALEEQAEAYELDPVDEFAPAFYFYSDKSITLGKGELSRTIKIRYLNIDDLEHLASYVPDSWQYAARRGRKSLEEAGIGGFMDTMLQQALKEEKNESAARQKTGKRVQNRFLNKFLELLAYCLNTPGEAPVVDISYLRACGLGQCAVAVRAIWEVNREDFLDAYRATPGPIQELVTSLTGKIMKLIKQVNSLELNLAQLLSGIGGIVSGGSTSSSTSLPANTTGQKAKSDSSTSLTPGATGTQSKAGGKKKAI